MCDGWSGVLVGTPGVEIASATPRSLNVADETRKTQQAFIIKIPMDLTPATHTHGCHQRIQLQRKRYKGVALD